MIRIISICLSLLIAIPAISQTEKNVKEKSFRFMFYNCENLFDTYDDPDKNDKEFLPTEGKYWSSWRYYEKLYHIYQVITALGGWNSPEIIGVCEIENRKVLEDLIAKTPLFNAGYEIIHYESPDKRGIDVGLMYRKRKFKPLDHYKIPVVFPETSRPTRDILYVKGITSTGDTLHIYINHWPSRWGGQIETEPKRMYAASVLRHNVDSLFENLENPNILISGDFNDYPENKSLIETLDARSSSYDNPEPEELYNISYYMQEEKKEGSHKYHGEWGILDQLIVSGHMLMQNSKLHTSTEDASVFSPDFLLEDDDKYTGKQPFRTYIGYKYHGGFSDHLPVYIDFRGMSN